MLLASAVDRGNGMDDHDRIALAVSLHLDGGGVVAFAPAGTGVFASRNSVSDAIALDGQGFQDCEEGHLIEMPVKQGFEH